MIFKININVNRSLYKVVFMVIFFILYVGIYIQQRLMTKPMKIPKIRKLLQSRNGNENISKHMLAPVKIIFDRHNARAQVCFEARE